MNQVRDHGLFEPIPNPSDSLASTEPSSGLSTLMEPSVIVREIHRGKALFTRYGDTLRKEEKVVGLLDKYRQAIEGTRTSMSRMGITEACTACAVAKGSCCFAGVEGWYDPILLLMNLLLGVEVPTHGEIEGTCLFVGQHGCKLLARHSFCVNYLCPSLKSLLGESSVNRFLMEAGEEIHWGWELERLLRNWVAKNRRLSF